MTGQGVESRLGFLDSLAGLFRGKPDEAPPAAPATVDFDALRAGFDAALRDLNDKAEECRRQREATSAALVGGGPSPEDRAAERARRIAELHRAIHDDIASAHQKLGTGLSASELDATARDLEEFAAAAEEGRDSHELIPRARLAIARRIQQEAGELAVARLVELMRRQDLGWPDPTHYRPSEKREEIEAFQRRRLAELRDSFMAHGLGRTAERMRGVVTAWGSDYPDRGTPLWQETVLEGVAAGIRAELVKECLELVRRDLDVIMARTEATIGKELAALQQVLKAGVTSLEQANLAAASALGVVDEVVPDLVWEHVRSQLPHARGEWPD